MNDNAILEDITLKPLLFHLQGVPASDLAALGLPGPAATGPLGGSFELRVCGAQLWWSPDWLVFQVCALVRILLVFRSMEAYKKCVWRHLRALDHVFVFVYIYTHIYDIIRSCITWYCIVWLHIMPNYYTILYYTVPCYTTLPFLLFTMFVVWIT